MMKLFDWPWARIPDVEEDALLIGADPSDIGAVRIHLASGPIARSGLALWGGEGGGVEAMVPAGRALPSPLVRVVLSAEDWRQITDAGRRAWVTGAADTLRRLVRQGGLRGPWSDEGPCFVFCGDGSSDIHGHRIGLRAGEFATTCTPSVWPGSTHWKHVPAPRLWSAVYVSTAHTGGDSIGMGGFWRGQARWTLGHHWLDSAFLPTVTVRAALTIEPAEAGGFRATAPDGMTIERLAVENGTQLLVRREGSVVLRVFVEDPKDISPHVAAAAPRARAHATLDELVSDHAAASSAPRADRGAETLFGADVEIPTLRLVECALLLPPIHFPDLFDGYERAVDVDGAPCALDANGVSVVFRVRSDRIEVEGRHAGATMDGRALPRGKPVPLHTPCAIGAGRRELRVDEPPEALRAAARAVIRGRDVARPMEWGRLITVGRAPRSHVRLLDARHTDGLLWKAAYRRAETVQAGGATLPRAQVRLDAIMTSSRHLEIDLQGSPCVRSMSSRGRAWILRRDEAMALRAGESAPIEAGDELWVGHQAFRIDTEGRGLSYALPTTAQHLVGLALEAAARIAREPSGRAAAPPPPRAAENDARGTLVPVNRPDARAAPTADAARSPTWGPALASEPIDPTDAPDRPPPPPTVDVRAHAAAVLPAARSPSPAQPGSPVPVAANALLVTDETTWDWELSRPYLLRLLGWVVEGDGSVGARASDTVALPVLDPRAAGTPERYALVRTTRHTAAFVAAPGAPGVDVSEDGVMCSIDRYTAAGDIDHRFVLALERPSWSMNPRTWFVRFTGVDPVAQAMLHRGAEVGVRRTLQAAGVALDIVGLPDGAGVRVWDRSAAQRSVHVDTGAGRLHALSGDDIVVPVGGLVRVGSLLYRVEAA